jgi:HEAT repeat protein
MEYAKHIVLDDEHMRDDLVSYERTVSDHTLGDNIYACQSLGERNDEMSLAKLIVLYLSGEKEIEHEIKRIFAWSNRIDKAEFLIKQLSSPERTLQLKSVELIGILKEPLVIPRLKDTFSPDDVEMGKAIIDALGEMEEPIGLKVIASALKATDTDLLMHAIRMLSKMTENISWKVFRRLLSHPDKDVRREAAFSIAIRKEPGSARSIVRTILNEQDRDIKHTVLQYAGMIPGKEILLPLFNMVAHDPDLKTRLIASRTLHRVQGILPLGPLYKLRNHKDPAIRSEVILRLGQYGVEEERLKRYLRDTLIHATDQRIVQSCIQALGYIAEHADVDLLTSYLDKDPLTSYNAALALTRTWRLEDKDRVLEALMNCASSTQRQVFLKYLIHRRGFSIDPEQLLNAAKSLREEDDNLNVHYLSSALLEFAPCAGTFEYLADLHKTDTSHFDKEAIAHSLSNLILHNEGIMIEIVNQHDMDKSCYLMQFIPHYKSEGFFRTLADGIFRKEIPDISEETLRSSCDNVYAVLLLNPYALRQFLHSVKGTAWQGMFVGSLREHATNDIIIFLLDELLNMLSVDDDATRASVLAMLRRVRNVKILPYLMAVAESKSEGEAKKTARELIQNLTKGKTA